MSPREIISLKKITINQIEDIINNNPKASLNTATTCLISAAISLSMVTINMATSTTSKSPIKILETHIELETLVMFPCQVISKNTPTTEDDRFCFYRPTYFFSLFLILLIEKWVSYLSSKINRNLKHEHWGIWLDSSSSILDTPSLSNPKGTTHWLIPIPHTSLPPVLPASNWNISKKQ